MPWWFWLTMFVVSTSIGFIIHSLEPQYSTRGQVATRIGIGVGVGCLLMMMVSIRLETVAAEQVANLNIQALRTESRAREVIAERSQANPSAEEVRQAQREANYASIQRRIETSTISGLSAGQENYLRHCQRCHDADGMGIATVDTPPLVGLGGRDDRQLRDFLSSQHNVVGLERKDLDALISYLRVAFAQPAAF